MIKKIQKYFQYLWNFLGGCKNIIFYQNYSPSHYIIFEEKKLIYIVMYKCGCSSVKKSLLSLIGNTKTQHEEDDINGIHIQMQAIIKRRLKRKYLNGDYTIFTTIRDPLERLISYYLHNFKVNKGYPLSKYYLFGYINYNMDDFNIFLERILRIPAFLQERHFKPMYRCIGGEKILKNTLLLNTDNLSSDFKKIQHKFSLPEIQKINHSSGEKDKIINLIPSKLLKKFHTKYRQDYDLIKKYGKN